MTWDRCTDRGADYSAWLQSNPGGLDAWAQRFLAVFLSFNPPLDKLVAEGQIESVGRMVAWCRMSPEIAGQLEKIKPLRIGFGHLFSQWCD